MSAALIKLYDWLGDDLFNALIFKICIKRITICCLIVFFSFFFSGKTERSSYSYSRESNPHCHQVSLILLFLIFFIFMCFSVSVIFRSRKCRKKLWTLKEFFLYFLSLDSIKSDSFSLKPTKTYFTC